MRRALRIGRPGRRSGVAPATRAHEHRHERLVASPEHARRRQQAATAVTSPPTPRRHPRRGRCSPHDRAATTGPREACAVEKGGQPVQGGDRPARRARSAFRHFLGRCRSNNRAATSASLPQRASRSSVHRRAVGVDDRRRRRPGWHDRSCPGVAVSAPHSCRGLFAACKPEGAVLVVLPVRRLSGSAAGLSPL